MSLTYRQLQAQLKEYRSQGFGLNCRLNASREVLEAELHSIEVCILNSTEQVDESQLVKDWVAENVPNSCPLPEPISDQLPQVVKQPIFHRKRSGLLNSVVHLVQCSVIIIDRMVDKRPRVPVVHMAGKYQRAWA